MVNSRSSPGIVLSGLGADGAQSPLRSSRKTLPAAGATGRNHFTTALCGHPGTEAVPTLADELARLISALHGSSPIVFRHGAPSETDRGHADLGQSQRRVAEGASSQDRAGVKVSGVNGGTGPESQFTPWVLPLIEDASHCAVTRVAVGRVRR